MPDERKKNLNVRILVSILTVLFSLIALIYLLTAFYFRKRFLPNTWIGDVYCTGRNADSVAADLRDKIIIPDITISWEDGDYENSVILSSDIGYTYDLRESVYRSIGSQNTFAWPKALFGKNVLHLVPVITYDESALDERFNSLDRIVYENSTECEYSIVFDETSGYIEKDTHIHRLDTGKVLSDLKACLSEGRLRLDVDDSYFYDEPYNSDEIAEQDYYDRMASYLNTDLVYDMGAEKIPFDISLMSFLIKSEGGRPVTDEKGDFVLDDEKITGWISDLCSDYNTYGLDRQFVSSNGKTVTVPSFYSDYGTQIDEKAELLFLRNALKSEEIRDGVPDIHIPEYEHEGFVRGLDDIGDTYVEVDLTDQYLYYYKNGELILETDIVSGDIPKGWSTPRGTFAVYGKYTDQYLYGRDYIDFVSFWMPYFRGYGFHDSDWRDEWGGDIYTYDGSHGCINMDKKPAETLYNNIEIGTPVIVYDY